MQRLRRTVLRAIAGSLAAVLGIVTAQAVTSSAAQADFGGQMNGGQTLRSNESLWSPSGQYRLVQQGDGNLVLAQMPGNKALWANGMNGKWGTETRMQTDGNVVSVHNNVPVWTTHTHNNWGSTLHMQDDANVVVRAPGNRPIWATGSQHSGLCADGDRARSQSYASSGHWMNPVPSVYWQETVQAGRKPAITYNYKLQLRYNAADRCSYALLSGGAPGDQVYLDRSTNGGNSWSGWQGTQKIGLSNTSTYTGAFRDGKGYWVRACSPRSGSFRCTSWF